MNGVRHAFFQFGPATIGGLLFLAVVVFALNAHHQVQQVVADHQQHLADRLAEGKGYTLDIDGKASVQQFYPMWGMSVLMALPIMMGLNPSSFVLGVQFILSLVAVALASQSVGVRLTRTGILVLLPWFALLSVRWADAWSGFFLVAAIAAFGKAAHRPDVRWSVLAGCAVGLAAQFRSDVLAWTWLMAATAFLPGIQRSVRKPVMIAAGVALLWMAPWAVRSAMSETDHAPILGTSNAGAVAYISLGQLPGNPWNVAHTDSVVLTIAESQSFDDPWTPAADAYFRAATVESVMTHPLSALAKAGWNVGRAVLGGLYVGEFPAIVAAPASWAEQQQLVGGLQWLRLMEQAGLVGSTLWFFQLAARVGSIVMLVFLLWNVGRFSRPSNFPQLDIFDFAVITLVASKLVLIALLQYEARHMNAIYLPLLMMFARRQSG